MKDKIVHTTRKCFSKQEFPLGNLNNFVEQKQKENNK